MPFSCLILKKHVVAVSHLIVTLQMMSNSPEITQQMISNRRRSAPVIIAHLPIDQACGKYCYDHGMLKKVAEIIQQVTSRLSFSSEEKHTY
jgi:hypothetical protein